MFTGIIETMGTITRIEREGGNVHYSLSSNITHELKVDQSLAHNGVCLTVVAIDGDQYTVTAIQETLDKTALKQCGQLGIKLILNAPCGLATD